MANPASQAHSDLSLVEHRARSVAHLFVDRVSKTPEAEAFRFPRGDVWESVSWTQVDARARQIAAGLVALGSSRSSVWRSPRALATSGWSPTWQ